MLQVALKFTSNEKKFVRRLTWLRLNYMTFWTPGWVVDQEASSALQFMWWVIREQIFLPGNPTKLAV